MAEKRDTTLIITEKPQAAEKIAIALSDATAKKIINKNKVSYYEFEKDNKRIVIGCAVGHLFEIQQKNNRGTFPNFDVEWRESFKKKGKEYTKKYYDILKKLSQQSNEFIVATDFDVEGEIIGWNVVRFIAKQKDAKRMKFSSLTKEELKKAYENLLPTIDWGSAIAGETRHYIDWFYGINLSRGLMKALSTAGKFRILSIGRVQGPALKIVVDREFEIRNFKPTPYWQVYLLIKDIKGQKLEVKYPKDLFEQKELAKFKILRNKKGIASTHINERKISPPTPFDLTTLQTECYRFFGLTPSQTLQIAQNLYLAGLISYPRTSSQKYPKEINYTKILDKLKKQTQLVKYAVNKTPTQGKKSDPAHPAIYPTGETKKLGKNEKKVYSLIVKRFISCFCKPAIVEDKKIVVDVSGLKFFADGFRIKERNWMNVYPWTEKEKDVPTINGDVNINEIRIEEKQTKPPKRYNAASLVKELEKRNLGTKSTRATIVETLYSRGYIKEKKIEATELGIKMEETLKKYAPEILDEKLTREMEEELEKIQNAKKDFEEKEKKVLEKAKRAVTKIAKEINDNLEKIGKELAEANNLVIEKERQANIMTTCPKCKKGKLRIMYNKKFNRYFVSCDAYPECKTIFSLPPKGKMIPARDEEGNQEICPECGFPLVMSLRKGKKPWKFCFNPECATNKEWVKKKEEFKNKA